MELDKIFEILMRKGCITTYELTRLGYINEDITEIINDGYIKRKERGVYVLGNVDKVLDYANSISTKKEEFSKKLSDYCNLINGVNIEPYYEAFDKAIQNKDVKAIFENYKNIDIVLSKDSESIKTSNLYLILLRYLFNTPIGYYNRLEDIDLEDLLLNGDSETVKLENKLRKDLFYKSFYEARTSFKKRISIENKLSLEDKIEKDLITAVIEKYRTFKEEVINLINSNKFKELLLLLYKEDDSDFLNVKNSYLLKVVVDYIDIEKSKIVPYIRGESSNTFQAIKNKDYKKALEYMEEYKDKKDINYKDTLYMMLQKINELIETLNKSKEEKIEKVEEKKEEVKEKVKPKKKEKVKVEEKQEVRKEIPVVKEENKLVLETKDIKRIEKQVQEVYNGKPVIILDRIDPIKNDLVLEELKKYREIAAFKMGSGNKSRVVVRSRPYLEQKYRIIDLVNEAKDCLFRNHNYQRAEELYRILLQIGTPRDITYGEYGLTLIKLHRKREAIPYLKIATELSKEQGHSIDYSDLIITLDGTIKANDLKPNFRMREEDFIESKTFNLKLDYLDDLVALVGEGELDLEEAMTNLCLDEEDKNIIRLICARDCYYVKKYVEGDKYLLQVEKSSEKSNNVKKILRVVKQTRKYYKNRFNKDEENQLVFRK